MSDLRKHLERFQRVSARGLKNAAAILMLLVSAGKIVIEKGLIQLDTYTQAELAAAMDADARLMGLAGVASIIQLLRGLLVPIFAFLLVEGFLHTASYGKYLGRVAAVAVVSEFAYDFAMTGKALEFSQQNPMLGLAICLVMLYVMRLTDKMATVERVILSLLIALCAAFWVILLRTECGLELVLLTAIFYCFRENGIVKFVLGILASLMDTIGPLAFCGIIFYNGKRKLKLSKYAYYAFYPLQYLVLGVITRIFIL